MSDLLKRARNFSDESSRLSLYDLIDDLADEIERLRAALKPFAASANEIEKCAALYSSSSGMESSPEGWAKACTWDDLAQARAALGDKS